jgi:hypothetical protein
MVQGLKLPCAICGGRAFYGSTRGPVCKDHKWSNRDVKSKKEGKQKKVNAKPEGDRAARLPDASDGGAA